MNKLKIPMEYIWLNRIRESGTINMFGAAHVLAEAFDMEPDLREARKVVSDWMQWVNENPENVNL